LICVFIPQIKNISLHGQLTSKFLLANKKMPSEGVNWDAGLVASPTWPPNLPIPAVERLGFYLRVMSRGFESFCLCFLFFCLSCFSLMLHFWNYNSWLVSCF
jgi:hypothetical protein